MNAREFGPRDLDGLGGRARQVMELAREEGRFFQQDYIGTEHILAALLRSGDPIATGTLGAFDVEVDTVRAAVHSMIANGTMPGPAPRELLTRRARQVLDLARREATGARVKPAHLLLGLLREDGSVAAEVLTMLDVDLARLRDELSARLSSSTDSSDVEL